MDETKAEKLLSFMREEAYKPLKIDELEKAFDIEDSSEFKSFVKTLNALEEKGLIVRTRSNRYGVPEKMNLLRGKIQGHAKGFAFLLPDDPDESDVFIPPSDLNEAMHGDTVLARVTRRSGGERPEGTVIRILERGIKEVVGVYVDSQYIGFVRADDPKITNDILIPKDQTKGAAEGHKVVVRITKYPKKNKSAVGEVIQILGHRNDPGVDILSIIHKHGIDVSFSAETIAEANAIPEELTAEDLEGRRDLREETIVTIDGEDAKDLDDAVHVKKLDNGNYELGVHIADVSYYVKEGSELDKSARRRGTSVYLVDRVIPMLPHRLSNGICSLNPHVDRLTISCLMEINPQGEVVQHDIFPSVIRSKERMTYTNVRKILQDEEKAVQKKYEKLVPHFRMMGELAEILTEKRRKRGAIDFDFAEAKVVVNEDGQPTDVVIRERTIAERLIEEFMLAANETVAEHFHWLDMPFIYRVHEDPDPDKLERFFEFITNFGYVVKGTADNVHPRALQDLLERVHGEPEEAVINKVLLRSMQQAKYDHRSLGHFGLAADYYTHFTSPIRRYPDLIVHRLIRTYLFKNRLTRDIRRHWEKQLPDIARHSSEMERRAVDAERETDDLKKAEFMMDKIGEQFDGVISGVTNFGLFVELPNTVEGLVHISYMVDDYYYYNERQYALIGELTGNVFRIGDEISVKVIDVDLEERTVNFSIAGLKPRKRRNKKDRATVIEGRGGRKKKKGTRRRRKK